MTNEEQNNTSETENTTTETQAPVSNTPSVVSAVHADVATILSDSNIKVRELVVNELTNQEITRRKDAVLTVISKVGEKNKELQKIEKQGTFSLDATGKKLAGPFYNKEQVESLKKLREEIVRLSNALTVFFEKNDATKLLEVTK